MALVRGNIKREPVKVTEDEKRISVEKFEKTVGFCTKLYILLHEFFGRTVDEALDASGQNSWEVFNRFKIGQLEVKDGGFDIRSVREPYASKIKALFKEMNLDSNKLLFNSAVLLPFSIFKKVGQIEIEDGRVRVGYLEFNSVNIPAWAVYSAYKGKVKKSIVKLTISAKGVKDGYEYLDNSKYPNISSIASNNSFFTVDNVGGQNVIHSLNAFPKRGIQDDIDTYKTGLSNSYYEDLRGDGTNEVDRLADYFLEKANCSIDRVVFCQSHSKEITFDGSYGFWDGFVVTTSEGSSLILIPATDWIAYACDRYIGVSYDENAVVKRAVRELKG